LPLEPFVSIVAGMKSFLSLLVCGAVSLGFFSAGPRLRAAESVSLEDYQKLQAEVSQLQDAYTDMLKRVTQLNSELERVRAAVREDREAEVTRNAQFATREDLKALRDAIQEVDSKRASDNAKVIEVVQKELKNIETKLAAQPVAPPPSRNRDHDREREKEKSSASSKEKELPAVTGEFYPHKVGKGENLSTILAAYNAEFKKQGKKTVSMSQVLKANPKLNPNNIYVGQEILIPAPEK
jgi:chromosome segregation ATPase